MARTCVLGTACSASLLDSLIGRILRVPASMTCFRRNKRKPGPPHEEPGFHHRSRTV